MSDSPIIHSVKLVSNIAGQTQYAAVVQYPGEGRMMTAFVGQRGEVGGPVIAVNAGGHQVFVVDPHRFGAFGPEWVRAFFA